MKTIAIAAAACALLPLAANAAGSFDGIWNTTVACDTASDGARAYNWTFASTVRNGRLDGQRGGPGGASSGRLTGTIRPDGTASLRMNGYTGPEDYSVGRVRPRTPFHFTAGGHFDASHGSATRNELRACRLEFTKS